MKRYLRDLARRRDLLVYLVTSGLKAQHRASVLGYFWWLLDPLLGVALYYFIVVEVFGREGGAKYGMHLVIGMIAWRWIGSTVQGASKSVMAQAGVITQVYLPKAIFPVGAALTQLFNFGFGLVVIAIFAVACRVMPGSDLLWLPVIVTTQLLFLIALSLPLAYCAVFFRDIETLSGHALRVWFFASPVIWTEDRVRPTMPWLLDWNPAAHLLGAYRSVLLERTAPDFAALGAIAVASTAVIFGVLLRYSRTEHRLVKAL